MLLQRSAVFYRQKHLLAIEGLEPPAISQLLDLAESYVLLNRSGKTQRDLLRGRTLINLFFEDSTRTRTSFELAGKRLGADVINMSVSTSSVNKGETLIDTAATLNAMHCDLLVVRHDQSGAPNLLAQIVDAAVINAGDGTHEHPTQALLDALTIKRRKGRIGGLISGDLRRHRPFAGCPLQHPSVDDDGLPGARHRSAHADPRRGGRPGRDRLPRHGGRTGRRRRGDDAAPAARADVARPGAQRSGVLPVLRPGSATSWPTPSPTPSSCIPVR